MKKQNATIDDVARRAGVSTKTVSRVINREPYVREELKERIKAAIADLGYVPSRAARQLAGNRSFIITLLFSNLNQNYVTDMVRLIAAESRDAGYHLLSEPVELDDQSTQVFDHTVASARPDGVILLPPLSDHLPLLTAIEHADLPLVRIAGVAPGYGICIRGDERDVSRALMDHLIGLGHRRIGLVSPHPDQPSAADRPKAYREALAAAGIPYDADLVVEGDFLFDSGVAAGETLLALRQPPTAIFAGNDEMALGVIASAHRRGLKLPQQLAVAGFDDSRAGQMAWPPLTTVRQPLRDMAACAVAALLGSPAWSERKLDYQLVVRLSTQA